MRRTDSWKAATVLLAVLGVMSLACMGMRDDEPDPDPGTDVGEPDSGEPDAGGEDAGGGGGDAGGDGDAGDPPGTWVLSIMDQQADAFDPNVVNAVSVEADAQGWLVVYADDGGQAGEVLGQAGVSPGVQLLTPVTLSRAVLDGETLHAALHVDEPVVGTFEFPGPDAPVVGTAGDPLAHSFTVSLPLTPEVVVADQIVGTLDDGTGTFVHSVTLGRVVAPRPGWAVVYDGSAGGPGEVIGRVAVGQGTTPDVVVGLDRPVVEGEALFAAVHEDLGTTGTFEFPGADVVFETDSGDPVVEGFTASVPTVRASDQIGSVDDAQPPARTVVIDEVVSAGPGFIVVYAQSVNVIGYAPVSAGSNSGVVVALDRELARDEVVTAVLHSDEGAIGTFEFPTVDLPVQGVGAQPVGAQFAVDLPRVEMSDVTGYLVPGLNEIVVDRVVTPVPSFITVRAQDDQGMPVGLLGFTPVPAGESVSVSVTTGPRPLLNNERVFIELTPDDATPGLGGTEPAMIDPAGDPVRQDVKIRVNELLGPSIYIEDQAIDSFESNGLTYYQVKLRQVLWADQANVKTHLILFAQDPNDPTTYDPTQPIAFEGAAGKYAYFDQDILLTRDVAVGEKIFAVFYADTQTNGFFDVGVDQPELINGAPVVGAFEVLAP